MVVIKVPKTPKKAFNKDRPPSGLLQAQVEHLQAAVLGVPAAATAMRSRPAMPATEGDAAAYIAELTARLCAPLVSTAAETHKARAVRKRAKRRKRQARRQKTYRASRAASSSGVPVQAATAAKASPPRRRKPAKRKASTRKRKAAGGNIR